MHTSFNLQCPLGLTRICIRHLTCVLLVNRCTSFQTGTAMCTWPTAHLQFRWGNCPLDRPAAHCILDGPIAITHGDAVQFWVLVNRQDVWIGPLTVFVLEYGRKRTIRKRTSIRSQHQ
eukprot:jgi/Botrbrau1/867/Bobra.0352s0057.1